MKSMKVVFSTMLVVVSAGAMAQETSMDAARAQRMEAAMQDFRTANPNGARAAPEARTPVSMMHKGHHRDGAKQHHPAKAGHGYKQKRPMADGAAPMAAPMVGGPRAVKP